MQLLPLLAFAASTGFALTVDVGVYSLARFAIRPAGGTVLRFAFEVGVAHAILLALGASVAIGLEAALDLDFVVDLLALILLTFVLVGVARRRPTFGGDDSGHAKPSPALSWLAAFALSLDALLVAPAANGLLAEESPNTRWMALAAIFLAIFGFTALYAGGASSLRRMLFSKSAANAYRLLWVAHLAELLVFCSLWATSALKSIEHLVDHAFHTGGYGIVVGAVLAIAIDRITRNASVRTPEVETR